MDISATELAEIAKAFHEEMASLEYRGEIDAEKEIEAAVGERFAPILSFMKVLAEESGYGFMEGGNGMLILVRKPGDIRARIDALTMRVDALERGQKSKRKA